MKELTKLQTCICDIKAVIRCSEETHTKIVLEEVVVLEGQVQEQPRNFIPGNINKKYYENKDLKKYIAN